MLAIIQARKLFVRQTLDLMFELNTIRKFIGFLMNKNFPKKALIAGVSGTVLQWYDFAIFGYFASIIASTYFPKENQFIALLSAFGVFAVGYLLAPLGAFFFGFIGDKYGRKKALTFSILGMTIPTALISILPGYQVIGITAPILLVLIRMIQGFVASSEFTGSAIFLVEHAPLNQKAFYGCLTSSAYSMGLILAGLAASFFNASFMPDWAWRISFAIALFAGLLIFYLRVHVAETPGYLQQSKHAIPKTPIMDAFKESFHAMLGVIGIAWLVGILTFGTYIFSITYLNHFFNISLGVASLIVTISLAVDASLEPFVAKLADRIGFLPVIKFGLLCMVLFSIPIFYLLSSGNLSLITTGMIFMSIIIAIICAPLNAYMVSLFPCEHRSSGLGFSFNLGISIFGGTTPLFLMWLLNASNNLISPAWYYVSGAFIGLAALTLCEFGKRKTRERVVSLIY